ncbi:MAG: UDP-N-acetylmuramoyl-L-alanyl-D-glutamate--2,6-diaminopimelate ligase [Deltaproteobacteria bacterium]|nr:UDP-N-acetylmuramoyl-L-alanyl-D-glutamate--2,6-diaminopimelate ligase [Deltaproteobacteria bacterium]
MKLKELLKALKSYEIQGSEDTEIFDIQYDSRTVRRGSLFVAIKGKNADGNRFITDVISRGAIAIVTDSPSPYTLSLMERGGLRVAVIQVPNAREALARISAAFYGQPASKLKMVGITGTNGKTTTSFLVESILREAGLNPGVIGTINYRYAGKVLPAPNTTPESLDLQRLLKEMVDSGVKSVVMEVSSHALDQGRVGGCKFDVGVFTNLTQDHLDYHLTMDKYFEAKARLFTDFIDEGRAAVINMDDPKGEDLSRRAVGRVIGYGVKGIGIGRGKENIYPKDIRLGIDGIKGTFMTPAGEVKVKSSFVGEFNLYNILAAVGAGVGLGLPVEAIEKGISDMKNVPGRLERVDAGQPFTILVDYAHTPDALERVLSTIRGLTDKRIITVFGCGGDRDKGKRPIMGKIAAEYSDIVIVTSDNPRTEDPMRIIEDIKAGMTEARVIPDRREAIREAIREANEGDVVLLAGKGHEDYQIIGEEKIHFDDQEEALKAVKSEK